MEMNRLNNFKNHLEQYNEKFTIINEDNLITATSVKFTEPTIEEKELDLINFHQQMLKNNNIQLMNKFKETQRNEIKKYKESHRKKEFNKLITPYRQEIINTLNNPANGFNLALTLNFNPVNLSGLFNLQMIQNKIDEWWKLYCSYRILEMGECIDSPNANGETALMMAVKRNDRKMIEYLLEKGASPNIPDILGITPLMVATFNNQLYNMALLHYYGAFAGDVCAEYEFDAFDIADITQNSTAKELLMDLVK